MMEFGGKLIPIRYSPYKPGTGRMNDLVEGLAKGLGEAVWKYYLGLTDRGYDRLVREAVRRS
jgi:hypothetical protein